MGIDTGENENGKFLHAEPNPDKTWTVFRELENGRGSKTLIAELLNEQHEVAQVAIFNDMYRGRRIRFNRMQAQNALRQELGIL